MKNAIFLIDTSAIMAEIWYNGRYLLAVLALLGLRILQSFNTLYIIHLYLKLVTCLFVHTLVFT